VIERYAEVVACVEEGAVKVEADHIERKIVHGFGKWR